MVTQVDRSGDPQTSTPARPYGSDRHHDLDHADRLTSGSGPSALVYTPAGAVVPRHTTPAPTTLKGASTLPVQMSAFAPTHAPSATVTGLPKKRKQGS